MQVALKAGPGFDSGYLCGPDQECEGTTLSSVGDFVWLDADNDGIQNNGEAGVPGVTVQLLASNGDLLSQTVTDANGYYLFADLVDGDYRVRFVLPSGHLFTVPEAGDDFEKDSDADPLTGDSGALAELAAGAKDTNTFSAVYYLSDEELAIGADVTNTAEVVASTAADNVVSDTDACVVPLPDPDSEEPANPPQPEYPPAWAKADFVIRAVEITPSPTVVGTRFRAAVRVANEGDIPGDAGSVELWSGNDTYINAPATAPDATMAVGTLNTGQTVVVEFNDLRAP